MGMGSFGRGFDGEERGVGAVVCRHYTSDWDASHQPSHHLSDFYSHCLLLQSTVTVRGDICAKNSLKGCLKGQLSCVTHRIISIKWDFFKNLSWNAWLAFIAVSLTTWSAVCFFCVCVCVKVMVAAMPRTTRSHDDRPIMHNRNHHHLYVSTDRLHLLIILSWTDIELEQTLHHS